MRMDAGANLTDRHIGIDLLRIISMFSVVLLHVLGCGGVLNNTRYMTGQYITAWFMEILILCAVDCFALISGYVGGGT